MENDDAGLPSSSVYRVLISTWLSSRSRRGHSSGECRERTMEGAGYGGVQFPSWSWCGWTSDALESPLGKKSEYKALMVNGCLPDVYEWLMRYTWIHWYIRDEYGNLRPLWHRKKSKADKSSEKRWKGYESLEMYQFCDGHREGRSLERLVVRRREYSSNRKEREVRPLKYGEVIEDSIFDDYGRLILTDHFTK